MVKKKEKSKKQEININFTFDNEVIFSFKIVETSDGYSLIPIIEGVDIHHTIFYKDGKIRSHITHRNIEDSEDDYPLSKQIAGKLFVQKLVYSGKKRIRKYHGNEKCYAFTEERFESIKLHSPSIGDVGDIIYPLELLITYLDMDFSKKNLWRKVRIRKLISIEPFHGYKYEGRSLRRIEPISEKELYSVPISKSTEFGDQVLNMIGINDFFDYFDETEEGKNWKKEIIKRIDDKLTRFKDKQSKGED